MKMKIIILILFCIAGFLIGASIRLYNTKSSLDRGINIECDSGICPPPPVEEKKEK